MKSPTVTSFRRTPSILPASMIGATAALTIARLWLSGVRSTAIAASIAIATGSNRASLPIAGAGAPVGATIGADGPAPGIRLIAAGAEALPLRSTPRQHSPISFPW